MKYWQIIAAKLSTSGLSWGCSSEVDATGRVLYTADAYCHYGKRFTVIAGEKLTAFLEPQRVTFECGCHILKHGRRSKYHFDNRRWSDGVGGYYRQSNVRARVWVGRSAPPTGHQTAGAA